ncbi:MAG: TMEM199/VMA12 family protein [Planctomycetota bacterium]|jgi:hypothetical protein
MASEGNSLQVFDNLLFTKIFRTFQLAVRVPNLIIAFLAITVICLAGWIMDFSNTVVTTGNGHTELQIYLTDSAQVQYFIRANKQTGRRRGVFSTLWQFGSAKFHGVLVALFEFDIPGVKANINEYLKAMGWAFKYHKIYCIIFGVIKLAIIALAGGAICRIAALEFARDEKPGLAEALRFGRKNFFNFFAAPLVPIVLIVIVAFFISLLGVIYNFWWLGEVIAGILTPFALFGGALIAVILVVTVVGFALMFPAVAYDGSDFLDAMARAWHYVFKKPWRLTFYTAVAAVYGALCYLFVRFFAFLLLLAAHKSVQFGVWTNSSSREADKLIAIWPKPSFMNLVGSASVTQTDWSESFAGFVAGLYVLVVVGLVVSFIISFYFSANTIIYAILRKKVDGTALEDIYTDFDETAAGPTVTKSTFEQPNSQPESKTQTQ